MARTKRDRICSLTRWFHARSMHFRTFGDRCIFAHSCPLKRDVPKSLRGNGQRGCRRQAVLHCHENSLLRAAVPPLRALTPVRDLTYCLP
jgi:hypothetical protein